MVRESVNTQDKLIFPVLCAVIFIIAFILRMAQPDLVEFKRDEATVARLGQAIAYDHYLPAVGVDSSVGIDNFPLTLYLMALPLRINPDPISAVIFTTLLNATAVVVCYFITQYTFGTPTALLATALFAVNPWAVLYARKIWCRTMPLFTLGFFISNVAVFVWGKKWALVGSLISLAALIGLQLEGIAFIPVLALILLFYREQIKWQPLLVGLGLCLIFFLPYVVFDAGQNWSNIQGLLRYSGNSGIFSLDAVRYAFSLAGTKGIEGQAGSFYRQFYSSVPDLWFFNTVVSVILGAGIFYACVRAFTAETKEKRRLFTLLVLWFIIPTILQLRSSSTPQRHYFVLHYPVQFILIGIVVVDTFKWLRVKYAAHQSKKLIVYRSATIFALLAVFIWGVWQVAITISLREYMVDHPTTGGYGIPLRYTRLAALTALHSAENSEIIVVSETTQPFMTESPTVFDTLLFRHPHRFVDGRGALPFPNNKQTLYLVDLFSGYKDTPQLIQDLSQFENIDYGPEVKLPDNHTYTIYLRKTSSTEDITNDLIPLPGGVPFANKVVFSGYQAENKLIPGDYLQVKLGWWLHGPPSAQEDYHFTVQLLQQLDTGFTVITQDDHAAFPTRFWQGGDFVLSHFKMPLPVHLSKGIYVLRAGMYSYPDIVSVPVINSEGLAVDDGVELSRFNYDDAL